MISHLLFVDDSLLFFGASMENAQEINDVLRVYCRASGQQVNMDKSSIFFLQKVFLKEGEKKSWTSWMSIICP